MRLLTYDGRGELHMTKDFADEDVPPYAILSHTWGKDGEEVTLQDIMNAAHRQKVGYRKIEFCGQEAQKDGLKYFWVDTCCIDKANYTELSEAIWSMYRWYQNAQVCYVYLADVSYDQDDDVSYNQNKGVCYDQDDLVATTLRSWEASFCQSRWFTRGWTLQELLAPPQVVFYSRHGRQLGTKSALRDLLHAITAIPTAALDGQRLSEFSVTERMQWTRGRKTKRKEDQAYCLLGIFGVYMPLIYGEGDNAFHRLQRKIDDQLDRHSTEPTAIKHLGLCLTSAPLIQPGEFTGRTAEIDAIYNILRPGESNIQQRRVVLGGLGGVGKTQLAIAYAQQYESSYTSILWLEATSYSTLYSDLRSITSCLIAKSKLEELDNDQVLKQWHKWLSSSQNTDWLLILDNYDSSDSFSIKRVCPNINHGSTIITTRLPNTVTGTQLRVRPLIAIEDSLEILQIRSGRRALHTDPSARRLVERMAGLPLALVTIGTYLRDSTLSLQQCLDAYEQQWQFDRHDPFYIPKYANRTLYTTWNITYDKLKTDDAKAAQVLTLLAYFDHQEIWYELMNAGLSKHSLEWLHACFTEQFQFESVMGKLVEYCFVEAKVATGSYSVHGCVHDWALGMLNREIDSMLYWYAFDCVATVIAKSDFDKLDKVEHTRVSRHGARLTHRRFGPCDKVGLSTRLSDSVWIAEMLDQQVLPSAAEQMYLRAIAGFEKALGPDHTSTLDLVNKVGLFYRAQGKLGEAEQILVRAWTGKEKRAPAIQAVENPSQMSWKDSTYQSALQATKSPVYYSLGKTDEGVTKGLNDIQADSAMGLSVTRPEAGQDHEQALLVAETEYAPSDVSELNGPQDDAYMTDFAKDLYDNVKAYNPDSKAMQQILHVLPDLLKAFAQKIGNRAGDQVHKDISYFFQKNRDDIRRTFKRLFESENFQPGQFVMDRFLTTLDVTMYGDIEIPDTHRAVEIQHDTALSYEEESTEAPSDAFCAAPPLEMYRNIITSSAAYEWLVATLYRELNVTRAWPDVMGHVGFNVLSYLPASGEVSRRAPVTPCKVLLEFDWDPLTFVAEQEYTESSHIALERAITLTGSAHDAQAATTYDYLVQTWPATGKLVMRMIKEATCAQDRCATTNLPDGTEVKLQFLAEPISVVEIFGPRTSIAEIAEQFSWLSAALRSSPFEHGIAMCTPRVREPAEESQDEPLRGQTSDTNLPGHCWHAMFRNPVIVGGYPILAKGSQGKGVEMPLSMIAKLARAEKANHFNGSVFLKGFSTMLLAVQLDKNVLIWHYLYNARGERISYLDYEVQSTANIAFHQLNTLRHVVGWCEGSEYYAGAPTANYDIDETGLEPPHAGCLLEKVSIGGGKFITASLTFALGVRDTPLHLTVNGYLSKLISIATEYFVLWDEGDKRGWLVNGASALLHLVKASLHYYSKEYAFAFIFDFHQMKYPDVLKPSSAVEILFNNRGLAVFPDKRGESEETTKEQLDSSASEKWVLKKKKDYFLFGDLVEQHYENLELITTCHRYVAGKNGINMKVRARKHLEGWDFVELATDHKHLNPRVATLSALGYGWVDFVRSIHAIPLFGRGFGDIIKPAVSNNGMCPRWNTLPKHKYYLAASMYDMKCVTAKHGNKHADPPIPVHGLMWHCPVKLLAPCKCQQYPGQSHHSTTQKHHDPVQIFYPTKSKLLLRVKGPGKFYEDGAVVFGHSVSWGYQWREDGERDLERQQTLQDAPEPEQVLALSPAIPDSHLQTLDPSLLMPQSSSEARNFSNCLDRTTTSGSSSYRSRVYTIGSSSLQTSERPALRMGSSVNSQTTASMTSPPSTNTTNVTPAGPRPKGTLDSEENKQNLGLVSEQAQQAAQPIVAADSENAIASSSRVKNKTHKRGWQQFWKKKII